MLVIKRKKGETLLIGDDIKIYVSELQDGTVKLAIDAPKEVSILREELVKEVQEENKKAITSDFSILKFFKK